jgi:hypothetical protein
MCIWEKELRQAFKEAIIRANPFTVLTIRNRVRELLATPGGQLDGCAATTAVDYKTVKYELLGLMERERPTGWALTTIPVVDEDGTPHNVWQFTPTSMLDIADQIRRTQLEPVRASLLQRIIAWSGLQR